MNRQDEHPLSVVTAALVNTAHELSPQFDAKLLRHLDMLAQHPDQIAAPLARLEQILDRSDLVFQRVVENLPQSQS